MPKKSSSEWFIDQLNADNAKLLALVLVLGFIGYHGLLHLRYGSDSCTWLLSEGRYKGDHEWQPYGCMLHRYSKTDARRCLRYLAFWGKYNTFVFIGDTRLQQLYEYIIGILRTRFDTSFSTIDQQTPNHTYADNKLRVSIKFVSAEEVSKTMVEQFHTWQTSDRPPSVIIASTGLELLKNRNTTESTLDEYKRNLTRLVQPIDLLSSRGTQVLWKLLEPVDSGKLKNDYKRVTNNDIDSYNKAAVEILTHSAAKIWNAPRLVAAGGASADGGLTLGATALRHDAQILLNMYCNDHMNFNDGSCCASPEPYTALQVVTFAMFFACGIITAAAGAWRWASRLRAAAGGYSALGAGGAAAGGGAAGGGGAGGAVAAMARLGLIMAYFYLCDRTNFFMKENKYYSEWSFWLPVGYVFAVGLFFTEDSKSTRILHREQTDEWKGWMQLVILVYQVTGASKVLPIYMFVRTLVSAYLFLTGYGHFYYTWKTGDTSMVRYFRVMFRLNFLTVVLCLAMNRPYQFYSFIPLVSFWYTLMFVIFALPPHLTPASTHTVESKPYQYLYIAIKIIGLVSVVTVLYMSEVFFQKIFVTRPWKALFVNSDDDIHQWWLRWKQDRYSTAFGVAFAAAFLVAERHGLPEERPGAAPAAALLAVGGYAAFALLCANSFDCDEVHSYAAFAPVAGYAVLRNALAPRGRHSAPFARAGAASLELFASHSHAWLAADTHGVLVLVPAAPRLNLLLTSFVFVCAAHELRRLTALLAPLAAPAEPRRLLRNVALFLALCLVPVGVRDGMF